MSDFLPVSQPDLGPLEQQYAADAVASTWIGPTGAYVDRFRQEFAAATGTTHAIPVSNGTVALHVALLACGIGPGDEVVVPSLTYIASVNAITYCGATPVFVDVEPDSWGLDPTAVEAAITPKTKAILAVHLYGMPASMAPLRAIADSFGLALIEDAAEAPFATYDGQPTGCLGDVATFSFFGNKVVTSGEGGAVTTNDERLAHKMELLRGQGMDPKRRYWFPEVGYNYRLTNVAAALICAQLERRAELLAARWRIYQQYDGLFAGMTGLRRQCDLEGRTRTPWLYPLLIEPEFGVDRDTLMQRMHDQGIETRPFFIPIHTMPPYEEVAAQQRPHLPVTMSLAAQGLSLPTFPAMTDADVLRVARAIGGLR